MEKKNWMLLAGLATVLVLNFHTKDAQACYDYNNNYVSDDAWDCTYLEDNTSDDGYATGVQSTVTYFNDNGSVSGVQVGLETNPGGTLPEGVSINLPAAYGASNNASSESNNAAGDSAMLLGGWATEEAVTQAVASGLYSGATNASQAAQAGINNVIDNMAAPSLTQDGTTLWKAGDAADTMFDSLADYLSSYFTVIAAILPPSMTSNPCTTSNPPDYCHS